MQTGKVRGSRERGVGIKSDFEADEGGIDELRKHYVKWGDILLKRSDDTTSISFEVVVQMTAFVFSNGRKIVPN